MDLGFGDRFVNSWEWKSKYFPSKVGGRPSFLVLNPIPKPEHHLTCDRCGKTLRFLLQIYAPVDTEEQAFHRTLFVFGCGQTKDCSSDQFRIFRCQLPRGNPFYSYEPPDYDSDSGDYDPRPETFGAHTCAVCGIGASHRCGKCLKTWYCCKDHQVLHWKRGRHKETCDKDVDVKNPDYDGIVFPELEITLEESREGSDKDGDADDDDGAEITESEMKKYEDYIRKNKPEFQNEKLEPYMEKENQNEEEIEQQTFDYFKKCSKEGEIIRYCPQWYQKDNRNKILWISNQNKLEDVPPCQNCGAERLFEFQIMPTLLNQIIIPDNNTEMDFFDFGTLIIFTCSKNCTKNEPKEALDFYLPEFIHNQTIA